MASSPQSAYLPPLSKGLKFPLRFLLFFLLLMNSRMLFSKTTLLPYTREIYLVVLLLLATAFAAIEFSATFSVPYPWLFILGLVAFLMFVSSFAAAFVYGQPFEYGLVEQRHALGYLIFFPVLQALQRGVVTKRQLFRWIVVIAFLCFVVACVLYSGRVQNVDGMQSFASESEARADRVQVGTWYIVLATLYGIVRWVDNPKENRWAILILLGITYVVLFEQSRQSMVALFLVSVWLLRKRTLTLVKLTAFGGVVATALIYAFRDKIETYAAKFALLYELGANVSENLRAQTYNSIFQNSLLLPHGALSMLWDGGFQRHFGRSFYLADVGIVGTMFVYGLLLGIPLVLVYYGYFMRQYRKAFKDAEVRACGAFIVLFLLINVFQPVIETGGFEMGLILAILVYSQTSRDSDRAAFDTGGCASKPAAITL